MTYLVLAYPLFTSADLTWIEAIRSAHDPQVTLITPHVTLIFPVAEDAGVLDKIIVRVHTLALTTSPIALAFRCALLMPEMMPETRSTTGAATGTRQPGAHLFLVPDEGLSKLVKLHNRLYRGALASQLCLEIPFIPHLTIGASNDSAALYQVAQELNRTAFALHANIDRLTIVRHAAGVVTTVGEAKLVGPLL